MASTEVKYIVKTPFKYDGIAYKKGDEWEPSGGRWDESLIRHHVITERVAPDEDGGKVKVKHAKSQVDGTSA